MTRVCIAATVLMLGALCFLGAAKPEKKTESAPSDANGLVQELNELAKQSDGENDVDDKAMDAVRQKVQKDPGEACATLLPVLKQAKPDDTACAMYIWALGLTKDPRIAEDVMKVATATKKEQVQASAYTALAGLSGQTVRAFLVGELDKNQGETARLTLLNSLAEMKYPEVLPKTEKLLASDAEDSMWKQQFVFGKLGDAAVPFLITKVEDSNPTVRQSAMGILGMWLMAPEAAKAIQGRYSKEQDPHTRQIIVMALARVQLDTDALLQFYKEIAATEKDGEVSKCIEEAISAHGSLSEMLAPYKAAKKVDPAAFEKEFSTLDASNGFDGDIEELGRYSSAADEPKLKALREHFLRWNSDEALYRYGQVNAIIGYDRLLARKAQSPAAK